jgi:uncharacterized protein (DUF2249 family)
MLEHIPPDITPAMLAAVNARDRLKYEGKTAELTHSDKAEVISFGFHGEHYPLPLYLGLRNHSPSGFAWGYGGSGPAQLALAILADFTGSDAFALKHYQEFKFDIIARLQGDSFLLRGLPILTWIGLHEEKPEQG